MIVAKSVADAGVPETYAEQFWMVVRDNITTLNDLSDWWILFSEGAEPDISDEDREFVSHALALLPNGPYSGDSWGKWTQAVKAATGRKGKSLFMPLRKALTGKAHGPDMSTLLPLLQVIKAKR